MYHASRRVILLPYLLCATLNYCSRELALSYVNDTFFLYTYVKIVQYNFVLMGVTVMEGKSVWTVFKHLSTWCYQKPMQIVNIYNYRSRRVVMKMSLTTRRKSGSEKITVFLISPLCTLLGKYLRVKQYS